MRRPAFSLLELIVVLTIISIVAGMGMVRYVGSLASYRADLAARRIAADIEHARREARATGQHRFFEIHQPKSFYRFGAESVRAIDFSNRIDQNNRPRSVVLTEPPYRVTIRSLTWSSPSGDHLVFDAFGRPSRGVRIEIVAGGDRIRRITLDAQGGNISID